MAGPAISIVTVTFNAGRSLETTFRSLRRQTCRDFELVLVDGGSTDETLEIVEQNRDLVSDFVSEPDFGVYDAINKGIRRARGAFVCILHAGDAYSERFLERALATARAHPGCVPYTAYRHGETPVEPGAMSDGIFFHYLWLNHSAFLVPRAVYETVGLYDPNFQIVSDQIWMRRAREQGIAFVFTHGEELRFAAGGKSTATGEAARRAIIREHVDACRLFFDFLSDDIAEALYLYRFEEARSAPLLDYLRDTPRWTLPPERAAHFTRSLAAFFEAIWSRRAIDEENAPDQVRRRFDIADVLRIDYGSVNVRSNGLSFAEACADLPRVRETCGGGPVTLHYAEVFSRPTETFVYDLLNRLDQTDEAPHVFLFEKRELPYRRPFANLVQFDLERYGEIFTERFLRHLYEKLQVRVVICHFASNGWRLHQRLGARRFDTPSIFMCHGIDVFSLSKRSAYADYILSEAARSPMVRFTVVSRYLQDVLARAGVPEDKITLVPNTVHDRFFATARRRAEPRPGLKREGPLRLLNIGRLVPWKGQEVLIEALAKLADEAGVEAQATFVYGAVDDDLARLQRRAKQLGVRDRVRFLDYVDFEEQPDFFDDFDIYVSTSTYSEDASARSETFGVALLEAIASGLPVVATDAGAQPEVVGDPGAFARIAPHGSAEGLAAAVLDLIERLPEPFSNAAFAQERLARFTPAAQIDRLRGVIEAVCSKRLRVALFSTTLEAGAGAAAARMQGSLQQAGVDARLYHLDGVSTGAGVERLETANELLWRDAQPGRDALVAGNAAFTIDPDGVDEDTLRRVVRDVDVVVLQWTARFLSIENIGFLLTLGKPVVFTLRDMQHLTGGCHFFNGCGNWRSDCLPCPQFRPAENHLPHAQFMHKRALWNPANAYCHVLSRGGRDLAARSPLFRDAPVIQIGNPLDMETFRLEDRAEARRRLNLPVDGPIVGVIPSYDARSKGLEDFAAIWKYFRKREDGRAARLAVAGKASDALAEAEGAVALGYLSDPDLLRAFYNACDAVVVPSREETFSNTTLEALGCGTAVLGFDTGAIAELTAEGRGFCAEPGDLAAIAHALPGFLGEDGTARARRADWIRERYASEAIGRAYAQALSTIAENHKPVTTLPAPRRHGVNAIVPHLDAATAGPRARARTGTRTGGDPRPLSPVARAWSRAALWLLRPIVFRYVDERLKAEYRADPERLFRRAKNPYLVLVGRIALLR